MADETAPTQSNVLGQSRIFTPNVINDIHTKAELGRYRMRGFSMFKKIPHWDELMFLPGTLRRRWRLPRVPQWPARPRAPGKAG
jgi:hypothetical protein